MGDLIEIRYGPDRTVTILERPEPPKEPGLEYRYNVERINDPDGKHTNCRYFVLDPQHDEHSRAALAAYAASCAGDLPALAADLSAWAAEAAVTAPVMPALPTEFGAHIVATVGGTERELIRYPTGQWVDRDGFSYRADQVTAWRWADNPRPLPSVEELEAAFFEDPTRDGVYCVRDYLREGRWGS